MFIRSPCCGVCLLTRHNPRRNSKLIGCRSPSGRFVTRARRLRTRQGGRRLPGSRRVLPPSLHSHAVLDKLLLADGVVDGIADRDACNIRSTAESEIALVCGRCQHVALRLGIFERRSGHVLRVSGIGLAPRQHKYWRDKHKLYESHLAPKHSRPGAEHSQGLRGCNGKSRPRPGI